MFQSLVITLREGVEAALIVGIVAGTLRKTGQAALLRMVYYGLAAAVGASVLAAYAVNRLRVGEDAYEGWLMLAGAVFVGSMVYWMMRTGKRMKREIEDKLSSLNAASGRNVGLGVFLLVFLMVFREGIETVLFLAAVSLRTTALMNFMGGVIGLALAVVLGVAFFKGSLKVDLRKFFSVTALVLFVVALQLLISGVHELSEAGALPASRREMALIGPVVNNDAFFFVVIVALCLFLIMAQRIQAPSRPGAGSQSGPEHRLALAGERRERFWKLAAMAAGLLIVVLISFEFIYSRVAMAVSPPVPLALQGDVASIPASDLADHKLHRYVVNIDGVNVRLLAIIDAGGTVHVALDACPICGTQGYYQDGGNLICRNCSAAVSVPTVGLPGGCNPVHVDFSANAAGSSVIITAASLRKVASVFR